MFGPPPAGLTRAGRPEPLVQSPLSHPRGTDWGDAAEPRHEKAPPPCESQRKRPCRDHPASSVWALGTRSQAETRHEDGRRTPASTRAMRHLRHEQVMELGISRMGVDHSLHHGANEYVE